MTIIDAPAGFAALVAEGLTDEPDWRRRERSQGLAWLSENGLPGRRDEPWHYFPTARVAEVLNGAVRPRRPRFLDPGQVDILAGNLDGPRVVFVNGVHDSGASRLGPTAGVSVATLGALEGSDPFAGVPGRRPPVASLRTDGTVALNAAAAIDGALISVGPAVAASTIHVVHVVVPDPDDVYAMFPFTRVEVSPGASVTIVESFVGFGGTAVVDAVTEIHLASQARASYHRLQAEGRSTIHLGRVDATLGTGAELTATSVSLGGAMARTGIDVTLDGDDSSASLNGLYLPKAGQHLDHTLTVQHSGNRTTSDQRFKGVVDDNGRGSFTGHVIVDPDTAGTSAQQANHNILLSNRAEADTRPWLEILADDVRCTHGATVGRLDDEALYYLRTRGIPEKTARELLVEAFTSEIIDDIDPEPLRDLLRARVSASRQRTGTADGGGHDE